MKEKEEPPCEVRLAEKEEGSFGSRPRARRIEGSMGGDILGDWIPKAGVVWSGWRFVRWAVQPSNRDRRIGAVGFGTHCVDWDRRAEDGVMECGSIDGREATDMHDVMRLELQ